MSKLVIVGIGNPYRSDDAAGWAVIDALEKKIANRVTLVRSRGDIAELIDIFSTYSIVYAVDACDGGSFPGSWARINTQLETFNGEKQQTSTHGLSLSQAWALAANLQLLPEKLIIYAIRGQSFEIDQSLSSSVYSAIDEVAEAILKEEDISLCMNTMS